MALFLPARLVQSVANKLQQGRRSDRNSQQDATVYQNLLFHVYMKLNMFLATHRPSSGV
jgi:hypothetical protein